VSVCSPVGYAGISDGYGQQREEDEVNTVLITGAAGNLGDKLRRHLEGRCRLRLLDREPRGDAAIQAADLSQWNKSWTDQFHNVDTVFHLAANAVAQQSWTEVIPSNTDATVHVYQATAQAGVKRLIYASSNHVMGGYKDDPVPSLLTTDIPPRPGARYVVLGEQRDSTPYGCAKLFGERLGKCYAEEYGLSIIAVRIGWVRPGRNHAGDIEPERGPWFRLMWLSNRDYCHLMERCLLADLALPFAVVNGMSANTGMRWDIDYTRRLLGYEPQDDVTRDA
jgi:uronate dehydrogenase